MKVLQAPVAISVQVELNYTELCGILKMIGSTSVRSREVDYHLTHEESEAISVVFRNLAAYVPEEDRV